MTKQPKAINNPFSSERFDAIDRKLDRILSKLGVVIQKENVMAGELADLETQVKANHDLEESAVLLINGIAQRLADAIASNDPAKLVALKDSLSGSATDLAAAIVANT